MVYLFVDVGLGGWGGVLMTSNDLISMKTIQNQSVLSGDRGLEFVDWKGEPSVSMVVL